MPRGWRRPSMMGRQSKCWTNSCHRTAVRRGRPPKGRRRWSIVEGRPRNWRREIALKLARHFAAETDDERSVVRGLRLRIRYHRRRTRLAVVRESGAQRARLGVGAQVLLNGRRVDGVPPPRELPVEPAEIRAFSACACDQRLGQIDVRLLGADRRHPGHRLLTRLPDVRGRVEPMSERCGALPTGWLRPVGMIHGPDRLPGLRTSGDGAPTSPGRASCDKFWKCCGS